MNRNQSYKSAKLMIGFIIASSTAVFAAAKFPYIGRWGKNVRYADGSTHLILLSFAKNGTCSYKVNSLRFPSNTDCSYRMQGMSAILTLKLNAVIKGVKHNSILIDKVTSQARGQEVSIQPLELHYMKDGRRISKKAMGKPIILSQLK